MPDRSRRRRHPQRVVVIGASLAGALAAAAAAGSGRTVTVLERDVLPTEPAPRRGVPQGRQPHVFLHRGLLAIEDLLPGFRGELQAAGAVAFHTGRLAWLSEAGWMPPGFGFDGVSATRPLFEHVVLRRVGALPGVEIRDGLRVQHLRPGGPGGPSWSVDLADGSTVAADLVIDASGRGSRLPTWLAAAGLPPARIAEVDARVGYAARTYAVDPDDVLVSGMVVQLNPSTRAGGIALPVEAGRWIVGATGAGGLRPPRDAAELDAFLGALPDDSVATLVRIGRPVDDVAVHRQTANRRHHYEDVDGWPAGLLVLGDALCAFDPVYGQGVTVAALQALELRRALRDGFGLGAERRLLRRFAAAGEVAWSIATGADRRFVPDAAPAGPVDALMGRWMGELERLATHGDVVVHAAVSGVYHLMSPPRRLLHPRLFAHALRARLRGYGPPTPRPVMFRDVAVLADRGATD